jgi:hypothetical protein
MINIDDVSEKLVSTSLGIVNYTKNEEISREDVLYLQLARKIMFCDNFNKNIDNLPDNIIDIKLGKSFQQKIAKFPKNTINLSINFGYEYIESDFIKDSSIENITIIISNKQEIKHNLTDKHIILPDSLKKYNENYGNSITSLNTNNLPKNIESTTINESIKNKKICWNLPNKLKDITYKSNSNHNDFNRPLHHNLFNNLDLNKKKDYETINYLPSSIIKFKNTNKALYTIENFTNKIKDLVLYVFEKINKLPISTKNLSLYFKTTNSKIKIQKSSLEKLHLFGEKVNLHSEKKNTLTILTDNNIGDVFIQDIKNTSFINNSNEKSCIKYIQANNSNVSINKNIDIYELNINNDAKDREIQRNIRNIDILDLLNSDTKKLSISLPNSSYKMINILPLSIKKFIYKSCNNEENDRLDDMVRNIFCHNEMMNEVLESLPRMNNQQYINPCKNESLIEIYSNNNIFSKIVCDRLEKDFDKKISKHYVHGDDVIRHFGYTDDNNKPELVDIMDILIPETETSAIMLIDFFDIVAKNNRRIVKINEEKLNLYLDRIDFVVKNSSKKFHLYILTPDLSKTFLSGDELKFLDNIYFNLMNKICKRVWDKAQSLLEMHDYNIFLNFSKVY